MIGFYDIRANKKIIYDLREIRNPSLRVRWRLRVCSHSNRRFTFFKCKLHYSKAIRSQRDRFSPEYSFLWALDI